MNVFNIIEGYLSYKDYQENFFKKESLEKIDVYRNIDEGEKQTYINEKQGEIPFHQTLSEFDLSHLLMDLDATSLYTSAMWDENSIYPETETGFAFSPVMNDKLVEKFNSVNFNQGSAISKVTYLNSKDMVFQYLPVE